MTFIDRVLEELDFQGKTRAELARFLNTRDSTIRGWIERQTVPAADTALKVAEFLNVSLEYLITGKEKQSHKDVVMPIVAENSSAYMTDRERVLLDEYRQLDDEDKKEVSSFIGFKLSQYGSTANSGESSG